MPLSARTARPTLLVDDQRRLGQEAHRHRARSGRRRQHRRAGLPRRDAGEHVVEAVGQGDRRDVVVRGPGRASGW